MKRYSGKMIDQKPRGTSIWRDPRVQVFQGLIWSVAAISCFLALISFNPGDQSYNTYTSGGTIRNFCGKPGAIVSDWILQMFGYGGYGLVFYTGLLGYMKIRRREISLRWVRTTGALLTVIAVSVLMSLLIAGPNPLEKWFFPGGWLGQWAVKALGHYFSFTSSLLIGLITFGLSLFIWSGSMAIRGPVMVFNKLKKVYLILAGILTRTLGFIRRHRRVGKVVEPSETVVEDREKVSETPRPARKSTRQDRKESREKKKVVQEDMQFGKDVYSYQFPPISLLKDAKPVDRKELEKDLSSNASILEQKLRDFGVDGNVTQVKPGPVVTQYEFEPAPGIKLNKIINLSEDLALAMKANFVPRVAHVPGKSVVGVEIPNKIRETVYIKDLVASEDFRNHDGRLKIALGKDIRGNPCIYNLESMPHLLVAGATGSGKSVCINSILISFLYALSPQDLQLLLIDPKMLELSVYNGIPHLRESVVTDPKKAATALEWAVKEMEDRYNMLALKGVRNIEQYNQLVDEESTSKSGDEETEPLTKLPYLVVVIDELADLMMVASALVENSIARLAQMARAAGIHLILATQRPSVDVLTGFIKANLPCRLAFQVSSKVDSRTILDMNGAEKLLGKGDMLLIPPGASREKRVHGAYVSESEIKMIVQFLKKNAPPLEQESIFKTFQSKQPQDLESDPLLKEAIELVVNTGQASISMLQRRLRVGHSRAARLVDMMELEGIVGPFEGSKPREILIEKEELDTVLNGVET